MWNQITLKSRPFFTNNLYPLRKRLLHTQSAINYVSRYNTNQRLNNNLTSQCLTALLPKHFSSSTSTSNSSVASKTHQNVTEDKDDIGNKKVIIDEQTLDKLLEEMDQHIGAVNQYIQSNGKSRKYKIYVFTFITMVAGVFAGAYAAHLGAWLLDKFGLFMFEEEDDD